MGRIESAREVYEELLKRGYPSNAFLYTLSIGLECKDGNIDEAFRLLKEMKMAKFKPYNKTYNVLIETCSKTRKLESCLSFYEEMMRNGFLPSLGACNAMIEKLCEAGEAERADNALTVLIDKGFVPDECTVSVPVYEAMIVAHCGESGLLRAHQLYEEMVSDHSDALDHECDRIRRTKQREGGGSSGNQTNRVRFVKVGEIL
ncbi:Pentatricopeptide repeat-containing protein [Acorus calamus]|uniref:Pentatricopeptide repeat-containing protein n=1 Tax=Acorus calamus TaxID=4465 RepID=A0AAV9DWW0_ACOCL|nr:Pentatricopeptide repeat-containing protein [Acorus calamus]